MKYTMMELGCLVHLSLALCDDEHENVGSPKLMYGLAEHLASIYVEDTGFLNISFFMNHKYSIVGVLLYINQPTYHLLGTPLQTTEKSTLSIILQHFPNLGSKNH